MPPLPPLSPIAVAFHMALPVAAVALALQTPLRMPTLTLAVAAYLVGGFAYTAGYHRLFAHRAYKAALPLKLVLAVVGAGNFLGPIIGWCRDHRAHHRHADSERDPFNRHEGFVYAYLGCRMRATSKVGDADVTDLQNDTIVSVMSSLYPLLAVGMGWILPAAIANQWGDAMGGFVYAGLWRTLIFLHVQYLVWVLGHTYGHQPYSDTNTGKNNTWLSIVSLGEGYLNFHREFPSDYRMGPFYYHVDATKWLLRLLSLLGLAYDFQKTPYNNILRVRIQHQELELQRLRGQLDFGPPVETLPRWSKEQFDAEIAKGRPLIILDSIAHDISNFFNDHPGGAEILKPKIGKDATIAFNGGVQRHSKAARNLTALMRVAFVENATDMCNDVQAKKTRI